MMLNKTVNVTTCAFLLIAAACTEHNDSAGITEEGNPIAEISSSSIAWPESSADFGRYKFDLWNGASGAARVNVGNNAGFWYGVDDEEEGGSSLIHFPVPVVNVDSLNNVASVVSRCGGLCGMVELGEGSANPNAGLGVALAEEDSSIDISGWDGLCVSYESELAMKGLLGYKEGESDVPSGEMPYVDFDKTTVGKTASRCAKWTDFKKGSANDSSGRDASKRATSLIFKFFGKAKEMGYFNIRGVSSYKHGIVNLDSLEVPFDTLNCLWNAVPPDSLKENVGGLEGGFWSEYNDKQKGGASSLEWGDYSPDKFMSTSLWVDSVVSKNGGLAANAVLDKGDAAEAFAGVLIQILKYDAKNDGFYPQSRDVSRWGGLCVTYMAEKEMRLVLFADSILEASATLPESATPVEKCLTWEDMSAQEVAKNASLIKFEMRSSENLSARFNIIAIGKYNDGGSCAIDEARVVSFE